MASAKKLISSFIDAREGWAVAEQFEATFDQAESFDEQNVNALRLIYEHCFDLLRSELLNSPTEDGLKQYTSTLKEHLGYK